MIHLLHLVRSCGIQTLHRSLGLVRLLSLIDRRIEFGFRKMLNHVESAASVHETSRHCEYPYFAQTTPRSWLSPHRGISKDKLTPYLRAFQLRCRVYRKPGKEALKTILENAL